MENRERRRITRKRQEQENKIASDKSRVTIPTNRQRISVRGALGELTFNVAAAEEAKNVNTSRGTGRSNYNHVQSKVDTGLATRPIVQPSSRPPLRGKKHTGDLPVRATPKVIIIDDDDDDDEDAQNKQNEIKKSTNVQAKKATQNTKKIRKRSSLKEAMEKRILSPILEESAESLEKLKLADNVKDAHSVMSPPKLPENIDIEPRYKNLQLLMSTYKKDMFKHFKELEEKFPIEHDHLRKQTEINGNMRAILLNWLVEVQDRFFLSSETFHLTVGIIDRYLQIVPNVKSNQLQLVGITAMFIASKYQEICTPYVDNFVYMTDNAYTRSEVFQCEKKILSKLGFCFARPTPLSFLLRFLKAPHGTTEKHLLAEYFIDLSLIEYSMAHYRPSELAAAAICLSLHLLSNKKLSDVWTPTLSSCSEYTLEHIEPIIRKIAKIVTTAANSKNPAVYEKYLKFSFSKVASFPQLKGEAIHKLADI